MNIGKYVEIYSKDLELKNYSKNTIENYKSQVYSFLKYFENVATKPSEISEAKIKTWLLEAKTINTRKHRISAVKLFYKYTGKQPLKFKHIEYPKSDKKLPVVLSQEEVQKMFVVCENLKHKVILALLYSCGLRVSELINLKWINIDRSRMIINIVAGKGNKDRQVMLDSSLIPLLSKYYREYKTVEYILAGQFSEQYSSRSVGQVMKQLALKANLNKRVYTHLMRHNCFTHMVENGTDINLIQRLAGHSNVKTTLMYTHISHNLISKIQSPISQIKI
ncbi:tyrosine-type recombinase/integrase [Flavobacterium sp.]|uniref:tyrosine-type recombinase/integrase n=1 Tax=Flavobacterium sp. TaxID=239 RepID=UPI0037514805